MESSITLQVAHADQATIALQDTNIQTNTSSSDPITGNTNCSNYSYLQLLRRITGSTFQISSTPMDESKSHDYTSVIYLLLQQPPEIRELILGWLQPQSLFALRSTNRELHNTVHQSERAICLSLAEHISKSHNLTSVSPIIPNFSAYFRVFEQHKSICKLARVIALSVCDTITYGKYSEDKAALQIWRQQKAVLLEQRLSRAYLILQRYLDLLLDTINKNEPHLESLDDSDYASLHNIFDLDQQKFMADYMPSVSESDFIDVTAALQIFKSMCKVSHVRFQQRSHAYPFASVKQVLIYKGLRPFAELLGQDTASASQVTTLCLLNHEMASSRQRFPAVVDKPTLTSIHHLDGYIESSDRRTDRRRGSRIRDKFIQHQDVWDRAARAYMMQKLGRFPTLQSPTTWIFSTILETERSSEIKIPRSWNEEQRS